MNRQNKKRMSLLLVFCLLITMGGFGNLKWANAADTTMAVADAEATEEPCAYRCSELYCRTTSYGNR